MINRQFFIECIIICMIIPITCFTQTKNISIKKLAFRWIETINKHDTNALAGFYTDSSKIESPNWEGIKSGIPAVKEIYGRYFSSTPDLKYEIKNIITTDNNLVIEYISSGTLQKSEKETPEYMRGKKYSLQNCTCIDIINGKITRQVSYFDQVSF
jgi:steroid delta-isomerase-like uncharacterized protein